MNHATTHAETRSNASLHVDGLHAFYGRSHILQGVTLCVEAGEVVALLGRNGSGKTTTFRAIVGLMPRTEGSVRLGDRTLSGKSTHYIARSGVAYVPSGRRSFAQMTVKENLRIAHEEHSKARHGRALDDVLDLFPALHSKLDTRAGVLSGGENQMLKMACAFLTKPSVLLLDEPTEGLAPLVVSELKQHIRALATTGVGILIAEQNARFAFGLSQRAYVLNKGLIQLSGSVDDLSANEQILSHLGLG